MSGTTVVDFDVLTLSDFQTWTDDALRCYLSLRSKPVTGTSAELAARAFVSWEEKIPVNESQEHKLRSNLEAYKKKLIINGTVLPDPFGLETGWMDESDSNRSQWPAIFITDIAEYLQLHSAADLVSRLCNEYKQGKAYRYFAAGWVQPVHYNPLHKTSNICLLSCNVMPSMAIRNKAYRTWAAVEKSTHDNCGGKIYEAYCTCPAGLQGSCNHIAGLLFRVEYAVKTGLVNLSSTSQSCKWNLPSGKVSFNEPRLVSELEWTKATYDQFADDHQSEANRAARQLFTPVPSSSESYLTDVDKVTADLAGLLQNVVPDSCFVQLYTGTPFPKKEQPQIPGSVTAVLSSMTTASFDEKLSALSVTDEDIVALSDATISQRDSEVWLQQRIGRITATSFHAVYTRVATLEKKANTDCSKLVNSLLGRSKPFQSAAMKHGVAMEPYAAREYTAIMRSRHTKFSTTPSGLVLYKTRPYMAASPDLLVDCQCHGEGLCEIKCPFKTRHLAPAYSHITYLEEVDGHSRLSRKSKYYFQVQGQMGVTGRRYCDFFVYTPNGHHVERIDFDEQLWSDICRRCLLFWRDYVLPSLEQSLQCCVAETSAQSVALDSPDTETADSEISDTETAECSAADHSYYKPPTKKSRKEISPLQFPPYPLTSLCGVCHTTCESDASHFSVDSIQCSVCLLWFHHACANVSGPDDAWLCQSCACNNDSQ